MGVCAENLGIIFGTDSLTEIVLLRLLAGWREERMDSSSVRNLMSELTLYQLFQVVILKKTK